MLNEEIKPGQGTPAQPSEKTPEDPTPPVPPKGGEDGQPGDADQNAEKEELRKNLSEAQGQLQKKDADFNKLGYEYRKLKKAADEAGIEIPEEQGLTLEQVQELLKKDREEQRVIFDTKFSELAKALSGNKGQGVGGGGQKPKAPQYPVPDSEPLRKLLQQGYKWDSDTGLLITPSGKKVDLNDRSSLGQL